MKFRFVFVLMGILTINSFGKTGTKDKSFHFLVLHGDKSTFIDVQKRKKKATLRVAQGTREKKQSLSKINFDYIDRHLKGLKPSKKKTPCGRSYIEVRVKDVKKSPLIRACLGDKTKTRHTLVKLVNLLSSL